jgi:hypothetical protein
MVMRWDLMCVCAVVACDEQHSSASPIKRNLLLRLAKLTAIKQIYLHACVCAECLLSRASINLPITRYWRLIKRAKDFKVPYRSVLFAFATPAAVEKCGWCKTRLPFFAWRRRQRDAPSVVTVLFLYKLKRGFKSEIYSCTHEAVLLSAIRPFRCSNMDSPSLSREILTVYSLVFISNRWIPDDDDDQTSFPIRTKNRTSNFIFK